MGGSVLVFNIEAISQDICSTLEMTMIYKLIYSNGFFLMGKIKRKFLDAAKIEISQPSEGVRRSSWVFWIATDALRTKMTFLLGKS